MVRLLCIHFSDCTGAQKHIPSERARGHSPREQGGGGPRPGPAGVLRTSPTAPFRRCVARGVQVHQQCKSLRLSRKAQHFAGKGEGGRTGRGRLGQPASPPTCSVKSSQSSQSSKVPFVYDPCRQSRSVVPVRQSSSISRDYPFSCDSHPVIISLSPPSIVASKTA